MIILHSQILNRPVIVQPDLSQGYNYTDFDETSTTGLRLAWQPTRRDRLPKQRFSKKKKTTTCTLVDGPLTITLIPTPRPKSIVVLLRQRLYRTSEAPLKLSQHCNIRFAHKPITTLRRLLTNDGRNLSKRLTEHRRETRNDNVSNHIARHHLPTKHQIDWGSATFITYSTDYYHRLTLEKWFTNVEQTNRSQQLLTTYWRNQAKLTGQLTIWLTINDCNCDRNAPMTLRVLIANNITA